MERSELRILVLSQHFWPESFRINDVVDSLRRAGCAVTVLTGKPNYPDGEVFAGYRASGIQREVHPSGYAIYRVPVVPRASGRALALAANYLSFLFSASVLGSKVLRDESFDVIFVYGISPILQAIPAIILRKSKRAAVVTWVQDLWPQSLESTGFVRNKVLLSVVRGVVRWIYRHSDLLLVQSERFISNVRAMAERTPVEYYPNPGDAAFSRVDETADSALIFPQGFNVVFAGNMGTVQGLDTIVAAAELLASEDDVRIVLIGSGGRKAWVEAEIARRGLSNLQLAGRFAGEAMPGILSRASALLVTLKGDPIISQTVPSKIQAYLAAGRPIIAAMNGEGARIVLESGGGIACPAEDASALAEAIRRLKQMPADKREQMGRAGRQYYDSHFEPTMLANRLVERFRRLVNARDAL